MIVTRKEIVVILFWILNVSPQCKADTNAAIKSTNQDSSLVRLKLDSFEITLSPTISALTMSDETLLHKEAENTIRDYLTENSGKSFQYALVEDIVDNTFEPGASRRNEVTTGSTTLRFQGGVAIFRSTEYSPVPNVTVLNDWVKIALEQNLLIGLAETNLSNITNSTYTSIAISPSQASSQEPSQAPSPAPSQPTASYTQVSSVVESNNTTSDHGTLLTVGIAVGALAFVGIALAAFVVIRKRQSDATNAKANAEETVVDNNKTNDLEQSNPNDTDQAESEVWEYIDYFTTCNK